MILVILFLAGNLYATDLVQVDVGTARTFTGVLNMKATKVVDPSNHGTHMAVALEDELINQNSKPVDAVQVIWDRFNQNSLIPALETALTFRPRILSLSYGGGLMNDEEEKLLRLHAQLNDTLIVAAAGNNGGGRKYYPANYNNPCIISVGTRIKGIKASYSNDAVVWVEQNHSDPIGTSASTARMAGIALQLRRNYPTASCSKIGAILSILYGL